MVVDEPTCTAAGSYEEVVSCTVCEEEVSRKTVEIAALGHTEGEAVKENEVAATCTAAGEQKHICSVCGAEEKEEIAALNHAWSEYSSDKTNHWRECTREECSAKEEEAHSFTGNTCDACGYAFYSEGLEYKVNSDTVTITGLGTCSDTPIYIPAVIEDKPVTEIGDYAFQYEYLDVSEVVLPDSVTTIGRNAFAGCYITKIDIPNSVKTIDRGAFSGCTRLSDIDLRMV